MSRLTYPLTINAQSKPLGLKARDSETTFPRWRNRSLRRELVKSTVERGEMCLDAEPFTAKKKMFKININMPILK